MTMSNVTPIHTVTLPEPGYPMLTRMISNSLFPELQQHVVGCPNCKQQISVDKNSSKEDPVTWIVGQPHPLVPDMKVMRMFVDRGGVEVYSVSGDGKAGMRNLIPMGWVRLTEEAMPLDVFVEELSAAESDDGVDDDEIEEPEPVSPPTPSVNPS